MARAVWKGPFVEESLMKKVDKYKNDPKKIPIKTWSRKSTIIPDFVGVSFLIYNGKKFIPITISEDMVEISLTVRYDWAEYSLQNRGSQLDPETPLVRTQ